MARLLPYILFFISGIVALGYQSVWSRYLGHLLGHAALAQTLAISAFMLGLGIGSWYAGKRSDMTSRNALIGYVIAELGIALWGLLFHSTYISLEVHASGSVFFQYCLALLLIVPPAAAMGATFPLFWRGMTAGGHINEVTSLPALYFVNALGGSVGALLTTFFFVPKFGLPGSLTIFWTCNVLLAVLVFSVYLTTKSKQDSKLADAQVSYAVPAASFSTFAAIAALTGATSLIYQVVWFRMVALSLGSSQHSFEIVLAAFIFSLAVGALLLSRLKRFADSPIAWCSFAQVAMGCFAVLSFGFWYLQFSWLEGVLASLNRSTGGYTLYLAFTMLVSVLLVFPTAVWAGMTLPLLTRSALGFGTKTVGYIYAWNTAGCMFGALIATHLLISNIGIKLTLILAGCADIALGIYLLNLVPNSEKRARWLAIAGISALGCLLIVQSIKEDKEKVTAGMFRHGASGSLDNDKQILFYRDGKTATISTSIRGGQFLTVATNGKVDGAMSLSNVAGLDEYTMTLLGAASIVFHPDPKQALVIGFGTGISSHTILADQRIAELTTVEIESAVVDAASYFKPHNLRVYSDRRSKIVFNDAKSFLKVDKRKWDVILSEPSNPWVGGVANLFSKEFYSTVRKSLNTDGTFVQWLQVYETNDQIVASALLALNEQFPTFMVFQAGPSDWLIVARPDGSYSLDNATFLSPGLAQAFDRIAIKTPQDVLVRMIGTEREFIPIAKKLNVPANSDFKPYLLVNAPAARFVGGAPLLFDALSEGDLQRIGLNNAGTVDVNDARDHNGQGGSVVAVRERAETESIIQAVTAKTGESDFSERSGAASMVISRISECDLRSQDKLLFSLDRTIPLFMSPISYPGLEKLFEQGSRCTGLSPELKLALDYLIDYSRRSYQSVNEKSLELLAIKGASPRAMIFLRQIAISSALITKNCKLANQLDNDSVDFTRKALIGACKPN